jgi:D-glycero-beta-D-manno-heptose-7-phosphate kinase
MKKQLLDLLESFAKRKIVVIGDLIADEFLYGRIARVSREAPVLVLEYQDLVRLPGGAANAANNLLDLDSKVAIAGTVGQDEAGRDLAAMLKKKGADVHLLQKARSYTTPIKTRILAGARHSAPQQVVRVDRTLDSKSLVPLPWNLLRQSIRNADAIIISDYGYGTIVPDLLAKLCKEAGESNIPIVVDSRFRVSQFHGVTSITPNITELEASTGISIGSDAALLRKVGEQVLRRQQLRSLLVTQGKFGMTLFEPRKAPLHIPIYGTDDVADVTGAGDTVIAVFTLALACGAAPGHAAHLANYAGGIVVMKRGTATVSREELRGAIQKEL